MHLPNTSIDPYEGEVNEPINGSPSPRRFVPKASTTTVQAQATIIRRDRGLTRQSTVLDEMIFISQPKGFTLGKLKSRYVYDKSAGTGQTVYIVDTGADLTSDVSFMSPRSAFISSTHLQEFTNGKNIASKVQWLFPNPNLATPGDDSQEHGTGMLSKVTGDQFGISKDVKPIVVRVGAKGSATSDHYLNGVQAVLNDARAKSAQGLLGNAILNLSWNYPAHEVSQAWINALRDLLQQLVILGVFPIAGSGNDGGVSRFQ